MVARLAQALFQPADFDVSRTNLHYSPESPSRILAFFIHGLGGSAYGTWGDFPKYLFETTGQGRCDVAVFDYTSGLRRLKSRKATKATMEFYISQVADAIRDAESGYDAIFLIGHSLGGIIAESAAMNYLLNRSPAPYEELSPLAAIIYMASPRAGSGWSPPVIGNLVGEGRMLRTFSLHSSGVDSYMVSRTDVALTAPFAPHHVFLPRYAFYSGADRWVKQFSSTFGIPVNQRIPVLTSHTAMVKPRQSNSELVERLQAVIREVVESRVQRERELQHTASRASKRKATVDAAAITTEFWAPADASHWLQLYNEVRQMIGGPGIAVLDHGASAFGVDLLISASHALEVANDDPSEAAKFQRAHARVIENPKLTLGFVPVGNNADSAAGVMLAWHNASGSTPGIYIEPARDVNALRKILISWIELVIGKDPRRKGGDLLDRASYSTSDGRLYNLAEERAQWT
jgi:pimeloyl-ACP methyl ester carboxylesterase